jgi:riboflavin synthase
MFTGIIEAVGTVVSRQPGRDVHRIHIKTPPGFLDGVRVGDSIAVDGTCLTVVALRSADVGPAAGLVAGPDTGPDTGPAAGAAAGFDVDIIGTTLSRTVAGSYTPGRTVNLEKAMAFGARLDGHLVQGHVDGVGELHEVQEEGDFWRMTFRIPPEIHSATILNGSITLNGVSLTVHALEADDRVGIGIIPHTWTHTNLSALAPGDPVNVEGDLIGKYVRRWLEGAAASSMQR